MPNIPTKEDAFVSIRRKRVSQLIEEQIKQAIFDGQYFVGDQLPAERKLAELFGASRLSVREALRSLERSGFVEIKKGVQGGAYITDAGHQHVVESMLDMFKSGRVSLDQILKARLMIEPQVAAEAAKNATPEDIERLQEADKILRNQYKTGDPARENVPNTHRIIARMSGNIVIRMIMDVLMDVHTLRIRHIKLTPADKEQILRRHQELIEALLNKDAELAADVMKQHILEGHEIHRRIETETQ